MFVSGFTIVRNAVKYDYPVVESIQSLLPFCDEVIVLIGHSEDNTRELIESIKSHKIRIHESVWDDSLREGGRVLAQETDKAYALVNPKADWCFYLQADEVVNDEHASSILDAMNKYCDQPEVEGLLFTYKHFFGSYDFIAHSRTYYRNEVRIIRNNPGIHSYRDAQGFRLDGRKLKVKHSGGEIFHYGWVRHPETMKNKIRDFHQLWHDDEWIRQEEKKISEFDYSEISSVIPYVGQHPACMKDRIAEKNWNFVPGLKASEKNWKDRLLFLIERKTGYRVGEYKNYELI